MDKDITLKNLDSFLFQKLKAEAKRQGKDLNTLLIQLLSKYFGFEKKSPKRNNKNNLNRLAGTWSKKEYQEFMDNTSSFGEIDTQLWK